MGNAPTCAATWVSGPSASLPSYPRARVLDVHIPWPTDMLSSDNSWMWPPQAMAETALKNLREEGGKGPTWQEQVQPASLPPRPHRRPSPQLAPPREAGLPFPVCGCHSSSHFGMKGGTQLVSQSDTVTKLLVDTQATTHSHANSGVSPTRKAAQAVARTARPGEIV